jgi:DNA modification methylase
VLSDHGSFYWFHNNPNLMTDILYKIKHETNFKLKNQITWGKINNWKSANIKEGAGMYRSILQCYGKQRSYNKSLTEYIYYFTFQNNQGEGSVYDDENNFKQIREYLVTEKNKAKKAGYGDLEMRKLCGLSLKGGGMLGHYWNPKQWKLISEKHYNCLKATGFFKLDFNEIKNLYDKEINEKRYLFNQKDKNFKGKKVFDIKEELKPFGVVWEYERDEDMYKLHLTPKPLKMIKHIIEVSSNENDVILDCFGGSGTTVKMAELNKRKWIVSEISAEYCDIIKQRLKDAQMQNKLF